MEDLRSDNGDSEAGGVELANGSERSGVGDLVVEAFLGALVSVAEGSVDVSGA